MSLTNLLPRRKFSSDVLFAAEKDVGAADAETEMSPLKLAQLDPHVVTNLAILTLMIQLKIQKV